MCVCVCVCGSKDDLLSRAGSKNHLLVKLTFISV